MRAVHTIYTEENGKYDVYSGSEWEQVKCIEENGDKYSVKITMTKPLYLIEGNFVGFMYTAMTDEKLFNSGFIKKPLDKYWAGSFKMGEWNSTEKVISLVPNEKWRGEKPILDRIIFRELETQVALAVLKNNELDAVRLDENSSYDEVANIAGAESRSGSDLSIHYYFLNPDKVPLPVRQAFIAGLDHAQLMKLWYEKRIWSEKIPGSICFLPLQEGYRDNYPTDIGADKAQQILEEAGYKSAELFTSGDNPVTGSATQFVKSQMKDIGIEINIQNRGAAERGNDHREPIIRYIRLGVWYYLYPCVRCKLFLHLRD